MINHAIEIEDGNKVNDSNIDIEEGEKIIITKL